jgi:hypothetical protein
MITYLLEVLLASWAVSGLVHRASFPVWVGCTVVLAAALLLRLFLESGDSSRG